MKGHKENQDTNHDTLNLLEEGKIMKAGFPARTYNHLISPM
ncbi:MAG: hypothetical protein WBX01_02915 [Nitrososphaeraceae archaeon]